MEKLALAVIQSHIHNETGTVQMGDKRLAGLMGKSHASARRYRRALVAKEYLEANPQFDHSRNCWDETVYRVVVRRVKNDRTPPVKNDPLVLINNCDELTTPLTPLPPKGGSAFPTPSLEVHEALREAREFRAQRKAERRQRRQSESRAARSRKRGERIAGMRRAVAFMMRELGVCSSMWGTRLAIQTSIERWLQLHPGDVVERAVNKLLGMWKGYHASRSLMDYPCGVMTFFGECRWTGGALRPHELRSIERRMEASVGAVPVNLAARVDVEALKSRMSELLRGVDLDGGL